MRLETCSFPTNWTITTGLITPTENIWLYLNAWTVPPTVTGSGVEPAYVPYTTNVIVVVLIAVAHVAC